MYRIHYQTVAKPSVFRRRKGKPEVKGKLSATVEQPLIEFLDSLPGKTRSEKLELVLSRYQKLQEELDLREQLAVYYEDEEERRDREAWELTVAESQWRE